MACAAAAAARGKCAMLCALGTQRIALRVQAPQLWNMQGEMNVMQQPELVSICRVVV